MTPSQLKARYENAKPDGLFFTRNNMKFAGDTMRNYGVTRFRHDGKEYAELYRKRAVKHGLTSSVWFELETMNSTTKNPCS